VVLESITLAGSEGQLGYGGFGTIGQTIQSLGKAWPSHVMSKTSLVPGIHRNLNRKWKKASFWHDTSFKVNHQRILRHYFLNWRISKKEQLRKNFRMAIGYKQCAALQQGMSFFNSSSFGTCYRMGNTRRLRRIKFSFRDHMHLSKLENYERLEWNPRSKVFAWTAMHKEL
jgi:hypothetical protein